MTELVVLLKKLAETTTNGLGEALRALTFVGNGFGCYQNFDVRPDAIVLQNDERLRFIGNNRSSLEHWGTLFDGNDIYRYCVDCLTIDIFWVWDGDGMLYFRLRDSEETLAEIINYDCKHTNEWEECKMN